MKEKKWLLVLLLGALTAMVPLTIDMYLPAFPAIQSELDASTSLVQLSLTASLLGIAIGQLVIGSLSDVYGRKKPLMISVTLFIIASFLCAFAPNIWFLVIFRFLQGLTGAGGIVIGRSIVRDLYEGYELTKMYALLILVMGLAPILAPVIGGGLLALTSWRGIFVVLSVLGILLLIMTIYKIKETLDENQRSQAGLKNSLMVFRGLLKHKRYIGFALAQGFTAAALFSYISGSSFVLQGIFDLSPQIYGLVFGLNAMGFIGMSQVTGRLAGKVPEEKILKVGFLVALIGGSSLVVASMIEASLLFVIFGLFLVTSSTGLINPTSLSLAMQTQDRNAGSASALLGLFQFVFGGIAAPLVGVAGTTTLLPLALIILTCQALSALAFVIFARSE
ncbi:MFS transporter [Halalkalibacillus sediminis]|uniref:Bcr/CflA family efflux transporter n=2 Tax=Halalkalibacillus sediminis TaxID=2018042 RepID=A0A2I0QT74_9BACI|nr:MFS transporter [Halalkalibacillus sediminis]